MNRKTNRAVIIILLLSCILLCSFSKNNNKTVRGFIQVYGNEPFTYLGIETEDNKRYAISASEEEISKLWKTQGNKIEITGIIISPEENIKAPDMLKDGKIEVSEWKVIE